MAQQAKSADPAAVLAALRVVGRERDALRVRGDERVASVVDLDHGRRVVSILRDHGRDDRRGVRVVTLAPDGTGAFLVTACAWSPLPAPLTTRRGYGASVAASRAPEHAARVASSAPAHACGAACQHGRR